MKPGEKDRRDLIVAPVFFRFLMSTPGRAWSGCTRSVSVVLSSLVDVMNSPLISRLSNAVAVLHGLPVPSGLMACTDR